MKELLSQLILIPKMFMEMFRQLRELNHPIFDIVGLITTAGAIIVGIAKIKKRKTLILPTVKTPHGRKREYTGTGFKLRPFCALHRAGIYRGTGNAEF